MQNQKYYPFERNCYYYGKLLTAKDFQSEQDYLNNKRRILNKILNGVGVLCGLHTYIADDNTIIVESGVALDALGREIVVAEPNISRINTIAGFSQTTSEDVYLGIEYMEEKTEKVYAPLSELGEESTQQYNKVKESYRLFIEDAEHVSVGEGLLKQFLQETIIFENDEIQVKQTLPCFANSDTPINVVVTLVKKKGAPSSYDLQYSLDLQGFVNDVGKECLQISLQNCVLDQNGQVTQTYTLKPKMGFNENVTFEVKEETLSIKSNGISLNIMQQSQKMTIEMKEGQLWQWIFDGYYKQSLDQLSNMQNGDKIWLAKLHIIRSNGHAMLDQLTAMPFQQYITSQRQYMLSEQLKAYYPDKTYKEADSKSKISEEMAVKTAKREKELNEYFATGVIDLPVGVSANTREPIFSDEIMHGLGKGSVYVDVGIEYLSESEQDQLSSSEVILGDASLFEGLREHPIKIKHAVKVYKDKGTFIVAVRFEESIHVATIRIRWFAFKLPETQLLIQEEVHGTLMISPDTQVIRPHDTALFKPVFIDMPEKPCTYEVLEKEGGSINNMGVYTAPSKEGVYTIRVQVIAHPELMASAFVVVKQEK